MKRSRIVIREDWLGRDRALARLAKATGFQTVNQLASHVLYELAYIKTPRKLYRALSQFVEEARRR